jgi:hypothetical protein
MAYSSTSPNVDNYWIGKGIIKFQPDGSTGYVSLGNAPEVEYSPSVDVLDHFSSMAGVRSKDRKVVREKSANIRIVLEEMTPDNLGMAFMGTVTDPVVPATDPYTIDIFSLPEIKGALRYIGQNDIGPRIQVDLPNVSIIPTSSINLISEEWGRMEITAEVLIDGTTGSFGTVLWGITDEVASAGVMSQQQPAPQQQPQPEPVA